MEFRWVDYQCLCRLEEIYRDRGISENSMSNRFRTIKAIWNKAIKDGVAEVKVRARGVNAQLDVEGRALL